MLFILFLIFLKLWIQKETFQLGGHEHNTNSVEASETMSTNSASSPIPSYMHNHSNDTTTNDINEKRRHKSSSEDSKVSTYIWIHFIRTTAVTKKGTYPYYISPIGIGLLWAKIRYLKNLSIALKFVLPTDMK